MFSLKDFMEIVNYKITEGSDYTWQCFGHNAYCLDSWNGKQDGHTVSVVFDREDQTVYEFVVYDYNNDRAYRWINPNFRTAFVNEGTSRNVDVDEAWEDDYGNPVKYIDLEVREDMLSKARAIVSGQTYDPRVEVPLVLEDNELFELMRMAHERDLTLNQLVEDILIDYIKKIDV